MQVAQQPIAQPPNLPGQQQSGFVPSSYGHGAGRGLPFGEDAAVPGQGLSRVDSPPPVDGHAPGDNMIGPSEDNTEQSPEPEPIVEWSAAGEVHATDPYSNPIHRSADATQAPDQDAHMTQNYYVDESIEVKTLVRSGDEIEDHQHISEVDKPRNIDDDQFGTDTVGETSDGMSEMLLLSYIINNI